ncbi:hypothetical protein ACNS7O_17105 (plasmid) [Haloferacaceae archaeon DSL9]
MRNPRTPLSPREEDALGCLRTHVDDEAAFSRDLAVDWLSRAGFEPPEAEELLAQLLKKGYLYKVDETIRIT